ncbi:sigma factor-like helix-turn-helix DNA-binding protein [Tardiphaga alba]|uniref:sigma factor-like helix-turn-helix DNA-binding protein n=1 Tax=Tardiphaga alba TaxID=340268 RepID=UPI001BABF3D6|nr:sigma factor-like helix-turn-helix DNA-binding protein [Tardiphaga alba]
MDGADQPVIRSAAMVKNKPYVEIATELGVSARMVEIDLSNALKHCARKLGRV